MPECPTAGRLHRFRGIALPPVFLQNSVSDLCDPIFPEPFEAEVIIAKQRNGPIGTIRLYWQASITKFVSIEKNFT